MSLADIVARMERGAFAEADAMLAALLAAEPHNAGALNLRAAVRHQRGDLAGALADIDAAIGVDPARAAGHFNRGNVLRELKRYEDAVGAYTRALALAPRDVQAWLARAAAERALGRDKDVAESCAAALRVEPNNVAALNDRAAALARLERFDEALACFDRALVLKPEMISAYSNRGKVLAELERYAEACASYQEALRRDPRQAGPWNNLAASLAALGRRDEAIVAYARAAAAPVRDFDAGHPLFNAALVLLGQGDYAEGFALYGQRIAAGVTPRATIAERAPEWDGGAVESGVLHIWSEQGVGENLLFLRLLPLVLARTKRVMIDCDARLAGLMARAYPQVEAVLAPGETRADTSAQIAMGDLPRVLGVTQADIAALPAIMRADEAKTTAFRARYAAIAQGRPIIGIAWAAPKAKSARMKGAALEHWGALLRQPYFFVSLQYGDANADIAKARETLGCEIYSDPGVDQMRSIEDFAAQIAALDHVVTISNTTAHVAGAMGGRCVVMAPPARGLHWYWGLKDARTPWYPSLHLVRRAVGAPWDGQVAAAADLVRGDLSG